MLKLKTDILRLKLCLASKISAGYE